SQLVTFAGREGAFQVWDLRLIRRHLADMGLDWELPPYPPLSSDLANPLRVQVLPAKPLPPRRSWMLRLTSRGAFFTCSCDSSIVRVSISSRRPHSIPSGLPGKRWSAPIRRWSSGTPRLVRLISSLASLGPNWVSGKRRPPVSSGPRP